MNATTVAVLVLLTATTVAVIPGISKKLVPVPVVSAGLKKVHLPISIAPGKPKVYVPISVVPGKSKAHLLKVGHRIPKKSLPVVVGYKSPRKRLPLVGHKGLKKLLPVVGLRKPRHYLRTAVVADRSRAPLTIDITPRSPLTIDITQSAPLTIDTTPRAPLNIDITPRAPLTIDVTPGNKWAPLPTPVSPVSPRKAPQGAKLTTIELIQEQGYPAEAHHVITEDGYVLELHRIPHGKNDIATTGRPVAFLQHGLLSSSADWIMNAPGKAFAYMMADAGYDVWMGNFRGNTYSRKHVTLDPDDGVEYWEFSWAEMASLDLPAMIDYVLVITVQPDLYFVGFSMGSTTFFAMMSDKPEYNKKVRVMVAMGPSAYQDSVKGVAAWLAPFSGDITSVLTMLGEGEFLPTSEVKDQWVQLFCDSDLVTAEVCYNFGFLVGGPNPALLNKEYLPDILAHSPAGCSTHTLNHYAQLIRSGEFRKYDNGEEGNIKIYGQPTPPNYRLASVTTPVALFWGANDWLAPPEAVARLHAELPNVIKDYRIKFDTFSHFDFIWAARADELVYKPVIALLEEYRNK